MQNYYELLNISYDTSPDEISRAITKKKKLLINSKELTSIPEDIERYDTELFFLNRVARTLLNDDKKVVYDRKLFNGFQKRKLDSSSSTITTEYAQYQRVKNQTNNNSASVYLVKRIHGTVINQIASSEYKASKSKLYAFSLLKVIYKMLLLLIGVGLIYSLGFWGALIMFVWIFRDVRHTPMSEVAKRKKEELINEFNLFLKNLKVVFGVEKIREQTRVRRYFAVRDKNDDVYNVRVKGQLLRGSLNVGDEVTIWCFGWGKTIYFWSGKNLRNSLVLQFS